MFGIALVHKMDGVGWFMLRTVACLTVACLSGVARGSSIPPLVGDGVADDTAAIQARLDAGDSCVYLPPASKAYLISRTLKIGSRQELRLDRFTEIRLKPKSNCLMLTNRDHENGDRHVAVIGGIWNFDNERQYPNPACLHVVKDPEHFPHSTTKRMPPPEDTPVLTNGDPRRYSGIGMQFENVRDFVFRDVTLRNPATFGFAASRLSYFVIDGVEFDYDHYNPCRGNMDGVHLDGGCHHGKVSNLRGACFDDLLALNVNDGSHVMSEGWPITDIDVDGIYSKDCHSAVRLLSTGGELKRINIRNVHGTFYRYAIGFTHFFKESRGIGSMDAITVSDCHVSKMEIPPDIDYPMKRLPLLFFDEKLEIGAVTLSNIYREERESSVEPTIAVYDGCHIGRLVVRDCQQVNMTTNPVTFFALNGKVDDLIIENTRFVASPGENIRFSGVPMGEAPN